MYPYHVYVHIRIHIRTHGYIIQYLPVERKFLFFDYVLLFFLLPGTQFLQELILNT